MSTKAVFVYCDERGMPILRKVRGSNDTDKGKDFKTHAARIKNGRLWWKSAPGSIRRHQPDWADRIIYNLPVVLDALRCGDPVWITEGEREADLIMTVARYAATTTYQGIERMTPEQAAWFVRGSSPIKILMDNDAAGSFGGWSRYMALIDAGVGADRITLWRPVNDYKDATEAVMDVGLRNALVKTTRRRTREAAIRYGTARASAGVPRGSGEGVNPDTGFAYRASEADAEALRNWKPTKAGGAS